MVKSVTQKNVVLQYDDVKFFDSTVAVDAMKQNNIVLNLEVINGFATGTITCDKTDLEPLDGISGYYSTD